MQDTVGFARLLRRRSTQAERVLWRRLRCRQLVGVKFRRQVPIGSYIVDFASFDRRIVIELDGGQHAERPQASGDHARDRWLEQQGFTVLRFWNHDVLANTEGVLEAILEVVGE